MEQIEVFSKHEGSGGRCFFVSRMPVFLYRKVAGNNGGLILVAEDSGIYSAYGYWRDGPSKVGHGRWDKKTKPMLAFAGREFDIPLEGGGVEKANGQWWDCLPPFSDDDQFDSVGINTVDGYARDRLFISVYVKKSTLDKWILDIENKAKIGD